MKTGSIVGFETLAMLAALIAIAAIIMAFASPHHLYHGAIASAAFLASLACEHKAKPVA